MFRPRVWLSNFIIWADEGLNFITGGAPDETVSSRLGRLKDDASRPVARRIARALCWVLDKIDPGHCDSTEEYEKEIVHRSESLDDKPGD